MTFEQILARVVDGTPGALAGAIMSRDGVPFGEYATADSEVDLASLGVEYGPVFDQAAKVAGSLGGHASAGLEELILATGELQLLFRQIDDEYFLIVALERFGTLGKARYLIRSVLEDLHREL